VIFFLKKREVRKKNNIRDYANETISYQESRSYTFDPIRSAESEDVNITTINIVYMVNKILLN
jgi:hypothetical protein